MNTNREWRVVVHGVRGVGDIGSTTGASEDEARLAALSQYGIEGERRSSTQPAIYEDDDFDVRPA